MTKGTWASALNLCGLAVGMVLATIGPAAAPFAEGARRGTERLVRPPPKPQPLDHLNDAKRRNLGVENEKYNRELETGAVGRLPTHPTASPDSWKSWANLPSPSSIPPGGVAISKSTVNRLGLGQFPGVVFWSNPLFRSRANEPTGPPRSLEILDLKTGVPRSEALHAILEGPDKSVFLKYTKSPDGRYILDLPPSATFPEGRYEIRIRLDGGEKKVDRSIYIRTSQETSDVWNSYDHLDVYVEEAILQGGEQPSQRTNHHTIKEGEKLFLGRKEEIDRTLEYWRKEEKNRDVDSSYELKWKTIFNLAKASHYAVVWARYDLLPELKELFEKLQTELALSQKRWFFQAKLTNIGISEVDISKLVDDLAKDLKALDLQGRSASYALKGDETNVGELVGSLDHVAHELVRDNGDLASRLEIDKAKASLRQSLPQLYGALSKLEKPALIETGDGNFDIQKIQDDDTTGSLDNPGEGAKAKSGRIGYLSRLDETIKDLSASEPSVESPVNGPHVLRGDVPREDSESELGRLLMQRATDGAMERERPGEK